MDNGDLDRAIADFDRAIALDPRIANAFINRGLARERRGDLLGALADFDEALRLRPGDRAVAGGKERVGRALAGVAAPARP